MASMSKRTQARNERELHELLRLPGNSQCADCGAKNPAWASWNLGIFLCMRCASLHRKLGTHISKVKSLSMDTWTAEQVENMKRNGNNAVNKLYNPKNKKPDMPLDADEVDSAMERFIRKKYQEKSLSDGKPEPPRRDESSPATYSRTQEREREREEEPPPPLPPKKGRFFGFGLRASASAYSLSKHDKKKAAKEPRVDGAFRISADDYESMSRMADARFEMSDAELQKKLNALRDMGFTDTERNTNLLRRSGGNVEKTIERLIREGPSETRSTATSLRPNRDVSSTSNRDQPTTAFPPAPESKPSEPSYNPFTQMTNQQTVGLSMAKPREPVNPPTQQSYQSNNPFGTATRSQTEQTGLEQSFQSMQLSHPLFPHSTGGYPSQPPPLQDPRLQYSMTPPVPSMPFQQAYVASPAAISMTTNPFFENPAASAQPTGNNPFLGQAAHAPSSVPPSSASNPFFSYQHMQTGQSIPTQQRQSSLPATLNPFGLPPLPQASSQPTQQSAAQQYQSQQPPGSSQNPFFESQQTNNPFQSQQVRPQQQAQQLLQTDPFQSGMSASGFPGYQYAQSRPQQQQQPQQQPQMPQFQQQQQQQAQYQQQYYQQPQPLMPQQTGRYDKNTILALYNYPQLAPKPLASIPEPDSENSHQQQQQQQQQQHQPQQQFSSAHGNNNQATAPTSPPQRSATMPAAISNMHSAGGSGSRNPFLANSTSMHSNGVFNASANTNFNSPGGGADAGAGAGGFNPTSPQARSQQQQSGGTVPGYHASRESMNISNLDSGRHSPDAFASLSARSMR
ncbi:hypothetical protein ABEF95_015322 [Exophiala dermatitidis]